MSFTSLNMFVGRLEKEFEATLSKGGWNRDYIIALTAAVHALKQLKKFY